MIDSDAVLPHGREKLLLLCSLLAQSSDLGDISVLTQQVEQTALDIGFVFAIDLVHLGWKPDPEVSAAIEARLSGAIAA